MSKAGIFMAVATALSTLASTAHAQGVQLGGDIVIPLEDRPDLGLFVLGYVNGHGPYRFGVAFSGPTSFTPQVVAESGLVAEKVGLALGALSNQVSDAREVPHADIRIGDKAISVDHAGVISDRDLNAYTPVRAFGGYIGVELLRGSLVTIDAARSQMLLTGRTFGEGGEAGADMLALGDSNTNGAKVRMSEPLPSLDVTLSGRDSRLRIETNGAEVAFFNTSKLGSDLIKASPYRYRSLVWTPDGIATFDHGVAADVVIAGRHFHDASIARAEDKAPFPISRALDQFPVEGVFGLRLLGHVSFAIDSDGGAAWIGHAPATDAGGVIGARTQPKSIGITPWLYKGRGVARIVFQGGPADLAGIAAGDEIVSLEGAGVIDYYEHIDPHAKARAPVTVVFRDTRGEHTVVLVPAPPSLK